jgi:radical SAM superfamily enzyme YgiQ (UPF0313 family)
VTGHDPRITDETLTFTPSTGGRLRIALGFPNSYHIGMSNFGFQSVFRILCRHPEVHCERFFLPDATPRRRSPAGRRPGSIESGAPLHAFHIIAFSLSFENDYLNILRILSLGDISFLRTARRPGTPLLMAGGIAAFLNPEPLADIFDFFVLGEAEEILPEIVQTALETGGHSAMSRLRPQDFRHIAGVYVPEGYHIAYSPSGIIRQVRAARGYPERIACRKLADMDRAPASSGIITPHTEFADMALLEVSRGCPRACRFCAVGSVYAPFRYRSPEHVIAALSPLLARKTKIGILGAAVSDYPGLRPLLTAITEAGCRVSISSLRADALDDALVDLLQRCGHKTFTIAPEAGSERLRGAIAKHLSNDAILAAVRVFARQRIPAIKLYFMIGLPTETDADIAAIVRLVQEIKHTYYHESRAEKWLHHIALSVSPFVPKPFTPFQWHPYEQIGRLKQAIKTIIKGLQRERKVTVQYDLPKWSYLQTLLSRGDRRCGPMLLRAFEEQGNWTRAFTLCEGNPDFHVYRPKRFDEMLPWDHIDHGIDALALWRRYLDTLAQKACAPNGQRTV